MGANQSTGVRWAYRMKPRTDPDVAAPDKIFPGNRGAWVYPLTYGRARIVVGLIGNYETTDEW